MAIIVGILREAVGLKDTLPPVQNNASDSPCLPTKSDNFFLATTKEIFLIEDAKNDHKNHENTIWQKMSSGKGKGGGVQEVNRPFIF